MIKAGLFKLGMLVVLGLAFASGAAIAADAPAAGLGSPWPNAQDVSRSPAWHVYVFAKNGVKFIQVNDATGAVQGAVATSADGSTAMALPLGLGQVSVATANPSGGAVIYDDGATTVTTSAQGISAAPAAATFRAADCTSVADCSKLNN